ncbi:MAG: hypothetical protein AAGA23_19425 [Pseudomonadota bacterium]
MTTTPVEMLSSLEGQGNWGRSTRTYLKVDDLAEAVKVAEAAGACPPTQLGDTGSSYS